jgi:hypothetical protein
MVISIACSRSETEDIPMSQLIPGANAVDQLGDVHLQMSYRELKRVRPRLVPHPYVGASETVEGDTIFYFLDHPPQERRVGEAVESVAGSAKLVGVSVKSGYRSTDSATAKWSEIVSDLSKRKIEVRCSSYKPAETAMEVATFGRAEHLAEIVLQPELTMKDDLGSHRYLAALIYSVGSPVRSKIATAITPRPCPQAGVS